MVDTEQFAARVEAARQKIHDTFENLQRVGFDRLGIPLDSDCYQGGVIELVEEIGKECDRILAQRN